MDKDEKKALICYGMGGTTAAVGWFVPGVVFVGMLLLFLYSVVLTIGGYDYK